MDNLYSKRERGEKKYKHEKVEETLLNAVYIFIIIYKKVRGKKRNK